MKHFTFIRHGQSVYNRDGVSGPDPELTKEGVRKASQLKGNYQYALVSCMKRTRETFHYAKDLNAEIIEYSSLCREKMSGKDHSGSNLMEGEENMDENEDDFQYRMSLLKLFLLHKGKDYDHILIIGHSGVIEAMTGEKVGNCEIVSLNTLL